MNLYLLERQDDVGYDEFDSIVVAAPSEAVARATKPGWRGRWTDVYCDEDGVILRCELIGTTHLEAGVVHASFNAG
ncbi:hypothetical protein FDI85_gp272 [Erwinia phage Machina]|uniref:Uncharacterized protein n=2 Tax=Machinavirus machina TaxID=2169990 RepID=A0A1B2ID04_9CAUD|nr:hypothetical protein BIZ81_gp271 [Erwinia phage vB_EamM_Huxley]YP_009616929.1 hypothetical protein FDI85_gp272 [Erwinia phage Machina]ANZ49094.1 hypothetical protein HUXLEY_4 [Erwinia phage vB_EamM_Huxley]ANZ49650.1 hypothetical protein MACHINA_4 [Erwinia phage Machina]